jgi:hypothetical protein
MRIEMQMVGRSILKPLESGEYDLAPGSTVADLIEAAERRHGEIPDRRILDVMLFLDNDIPVQYDTPLSETSKVKVMLKIFGG